MSKYPNFLYRLLAVCKRHKKCYFKHLIANGLPPFVEPLMFILALGFGLGKYVAEIDGMSFISFIAPAMMATSSFYTASFETTYGTFIRMEYQKTYHNILATPVTFKEIYWGELLWCGIKGFIFSSCVLFVISFFGLVKYPYALLTPFIGFISAISFGMIGLFVTGFMKNINNFNLYHTGFLTPMFFFSGTFFPLKEMPSNFIWLAKSFPLTHSVIIMRSLANGHLSFDLFLNFFFLCIIPIPFGIYGYYKLKRRLMY